jgi:TM2 domain-containing membrane protein YozV
MKHLFLIFALGLCIVSATQASVSSYVVNEQSVDQLIDKAVVTDMLTVNAPDLSFGSSSFSPAVMAGKDKDAIVAIVLDFFLGGLGIHRFYLGTETLTGIGYILTCGGIFGIVPLIDFVVLIINNKDIGAFVNNPKFFMWN